MQINKESSIQWEVNNWYETDDGLLRLCAQNGGTVILTEPFKKVWLNINYETNLAKLWQSVEKSITWENFCSIIHQLQTHKLVRIINKQDEFDSIFN